ncbi:hypothetical protein MATR_04390 [Marivirga tractuosa]|uniref:DUF2154 domain-containing protein n=1 Tax=Marivirga tractuosa (strain ATCC 23168 / DSM 4126 / NBRC 15989 / NCIMB 1408 / VKM B-1430 / H-43) TaxID=643867 RepID=E4TT97_MARTH|nr:hypothetical protein [Marivirga tractuosa]ADR21927.1 hypothetical protein Ftrac_1942 [Marivirga tractuosa DSM 4126]BDD13614.1 hypothetical protein MATR_04390 [Marivirga tractuosa]
MAKALHQILLFTSLSLIASPLVGQELHKHFELTESKGIDKIELKVSTKAGKSFLNAVDEDEPLLILGASENDVAASTFKIEKTSNTQKVDAELTCKSHMGLNFTESVANNFFSTSDQVHDIWQINLSEHQAFNLNLNYLMGEANVDLSRLAIERLKINSASADVKLTYKEGIMNSVAMDTFFVKVNFGNIEVIDLNYALAKEIIAEVGFGTLSIDCGSDWKMNSRVSASVGAGTLNVVLPPAEIPVLIRINNSPLCNIKMAKDFEKIGHNTFGNQAYINNPDESMEFLLDVGMGSIAFKNR